MWDLVPTGLHRLPISKHIPSGPAIADRNSENHKASTSAWQRASKAEPSVAMAVVQSPTLSALIATCWMLGGGLYYLYNLEILDWWKFSREPFMCSPRCTASKLSQECPACATTSAFRDIAWSGPIWGSVFLTPGGCDSNNYARDLLMGLWLKDTLGTSAPTLTQEQNNQNKVNRKKVNNSR